MFLPRVRMSQRLIRTIAIFLMMVDATLSFSWGREEQVTRRSKLPVDHEVFIPQDHVRLEARHDIYAIAVKELQELEAAPLCHRVAARLLMNHCELVDGKNEATILTDSGHQIRDFVDAFAASLAICDLERGSFQIPKECRELQEPALTRLTLESQGKMNFHLTTREIAKCLKALSTSDAAWVTWVSYRERAVRFCEAARADNEKAQHILLYQRLATVIGKLAVGVELELERRMHDLEARTRRSSEAIDRLNPRVNDIKSGLDKVHQYLVSDLKESMQQSSDTVKEGIAHAENLQRMLAVLMSSVLQGTSQLAAANEKSIQEASLKVTTEMSAVMAIVATAASSSVSLQKQIELSQKHTSELCSKQNTLSEGMNRLINVTEELSSKFDTHVELLDQASNVTSDIFDTLKDAAAVADNVNQYVQQGAINGGWWQHVIWPAVSLVLGSYGLPPSVFRNLGLLALGEALGLLVSSFKSFDPPFSFDTSGSIFGNMTTAASAFRLVRNI